VISDLCCAFLFIFFSFFSLVFLAFFLFFLRVCSGVVVIANTFGISSRSVNNYTKRFVRAVNKLGKYYIAWPSPQRRRELSDYAWESFGFRGCIGSRDVSQVPLTYPPRAQPWTYWDRHDRYSVHVLMACDHERNIIPVTLGCTGAAGDALVQHHAAWSQRPGDHLFLFEHLLGDKGMHSTRWVVWSYQGIDEDAQSNKNINWQVARVRAFSKHVFGMLKGHWASPHELRLPIGCELDFLWALDWVLACCVLHNVCNSLGDADIPESLHADVAADPLPADEGAEQSRTRVKRDVLTFMKATGLYKY